MNDKLKKRFWIILIIIGIVLLIGLYIQILKIREANIERWNSGTFAGNDASNFYIVDKDDNLWVAGENGDGQVGNGTYDNVEEPVKVMENVYYVCDGSQSTFVIDKDKNLWAWGTNYIGQLGIAGVGIKAIDVNVPTKVMEDVTYVKNISNSTYIIKEDGTLWGCGRNKFGQLGIGGVGDTATPVKILDNMKSVTGFRFVTYAIGRDNSLWGWGCNEYSQITYEDKDRHIKKAQKILDNIIYVTTNGETTYAIDVDGGLWAWGNNDRGQIGNGTKGDVVLVPTKVLDDVSELYLGNYVAYALKKDNTLWSWGQENTGRGNVVENLTPDVILENVKSVDIKTRFIYDDSYAPETSFAVDMDGNLWAWGENTYGEAGIPNITKVIKPTIIQEDVESVHSGHGNYVENSTGASYILKKDKSVWTWECDDEDISEINFEKLIENVNKVAMVGLSPQFVLDDGSYWVFIDEIEYDEKLDGVLYEKLKGVEVKYAVEEKGFVFLHLESYIPFS